jgi:glycogen debranching enzyme
MKKYTELMASIFHAFRIDNCHSTPIHVAEYLLKVARIVRTELYVCAELFTGSADRDMEFITKLGLSSLIREAMVSGSPQELCHNASQYSGRIIGSFAPSYGDSRNESSLNVTQVPHALFADCTHDNETPFQRRCASDALPNTALVAMSVCGAASVIGYDQLFPYRIDIVGDQRIFGSFDCGILPVKKILNRVHVKMMEEGYTEFFADSSASNMITTIRSNPVTRASYLLLSCHAFVHDHVRKDLSLEFDYCHVDLVLFSCLRVDEDHRPTSKKYMEGFDSSLDLCVDRMDEKFGYFEKIGTKTKVFIRQMQPGSVVLLHRMPAKDCKDLLLSLDSSSLFNDLPKMITNMNLDHLNLLLYRCDKEERDSEYPGGAYDVPGFGPLAYCGLEGFYRICKELEKTNDIGHPFCQNLISGPWMMDYICNRMKPYVELAEFGKWLQSIFEMVKDLDAHLIPKYFCRIIIHLRNELASRGIVLLGVQNSSSLMQKLALVSIQMIGQVKSTGLYPKGMQRTMSAGLPHFTTHHMRVWGRDVFIAFKGMFLLLGRFEEAKEHLIAFAGCMYRGLIPNLLDSGRRPRYNARDTTWFFLQALQDYSSLVPNQKEHVLDWDIPMRFDGEEYVDFVDPNIYKKTQKMKDIVNAILQAHINGIEFTEWNAGKSLDHVMKPEGFVVKAGIDHQKGFVYGGSRFNCGTWMDKMGESELAKNAGIPATPRDGCAIELTSLLKSCLKWLIHLADDIYPYKVLKTVDGHTQSLTDLSNQIQKNFKTCFYIPLGMPTRHFGLFNIHRLSKRSTV